LAYNNENQQGLTKGEGIMPPVVIWALGAVGAAVLVKFVMKEARRINAELDEARAGRVAEKADHERYPTLSRDPASGEYRLR
jgi:hypothetical protein